MGALIARHGQYLALTGKQKLLGVMEKKNKRWIAVYSHFPVP
jgi:hypothetical protein